MPAIPRSSPYSRGLTCRPTPMPRTLDPAKYPDEFHLLLERAQAGPVEIPHDAPAGLRGYLQAFLRAVEQGSNPLKAAQAKSLQVTADAKRGVVTICKRSDGKYAQAVARALGTSIDAEGQALADRLLAGSSSSPI